MDKKITYAALAVVLILLVAAVAIVATDGDEEKDETADDVKFLIQDNDGVYFWAFGEGETVMDAFKDAVATNDMPFTASKNKDTNEDDGIAELFGLKMEQKDGKWFWWTQYTWTNDAWTASEKMMNGYTPEEAGHFVACVYGDGTTDVKTLAKPADAIVWDGDKTGVTFTIQNGNNLFFKINGEGKTMLDAFTDATTDYKIAFKASGNPPDGIDWVFNDGMNMKQVDTEGKSWSYWIQSYKNADSEDWKQGELMMGNMESSAFSQCLVQYGTVTF